MWWEFIKTSTISATFRLLLFHRCENNQRILLKLTWLISGSTIIRTQVQWTFIGYLISVYSLLTWLKRILTFSNTETRQAITGQSQSACPISLSTVIGSGLNTMSYKGSNLSVLGRIIRWLHSLYLLSYCHDIITFQGNM